MQSCWWHVRMAISTIWASNWCLTCAIRICHLLAVVVTAEIYFYGKCGKLEEAVQASSSSGLAIAARNPSINCWNALIGAHAHFGDVEGAKRAGLALMKAGLHPNELTLTNLLMAGSHAGLGLRAIDLLKWAVVFFEVQPDVIHVASVVDALARAGHLKEAHDFILSMSSEDSPVKAH